MVWNNATILDTVFVEGSPSYQARVPEVTQGDISATQQFLFEPQNRKYWNEFQDGLVNVVGAQIVQDPDWKNPLGEFKKDGLLPMGGSIEEIALDFVEAQGYSIRNDNLFKTNPGKVYSAFHTVNRKDLYEISINESELRQAFNSEFGLNNFLIAKLNKPGISDEYDEMRLMAQLIDETAKHNRVFRVATPFANANRPTEAELKDLSAAIRTTAKRMAVAPSGKFNAKGVPTVSQQKDLVVITTPEVVARLDVYSLADSFHVDRADFASKVIEIDTFPIPGVYAMIVDRAWFVCGDYLRDVTSFYNPKTRVTNFYLHHWGVYSVSPFSNAAIFGEVVDSETGEAIVSLTGLSTAVNKAEDGSLAVKFEYGIDYIVTVKATGEDIPNTSGVIVPDAFTAEVTLATSEGVAIERDDIRTYVDRTGALHVQDGLSLGDVVTVKVTSTYATPAGDPDAVPKTASVSISVG